MPTPDELVEQASARLAKRKEKEDEAEKNQVERLQQSYLKRTGRTEMKP